MSARTHVLLVFLLTAVVHGDFCRELFAMPPNIVLIISDDQAYGDFGFMGNPLVQTPHIDELASCSATFVNGYVPYSVCRPSLATLLTGRYPHQNGIYFNRPYFDLPHTLENRHRANHLIRQVPTLPGLLSRVGYRTLQTGKHWEGDYANAGFTEGMTLARPHPIEQDPAFAALGMKSGHSNGDAGLLIGRRTMQPIFEFVDRATEAQKPFFVWYAPFLPHLPHNAPEKYVAMYEKDRRVPAAVRPYYASISWLDDTVGELLKHLKLREQLRRTVVVFVIDNGWGPVPTRENEEIVSKGKNTPFERGIRTPLLIRWDGHARPKTHAGLVSSVDVMPTLLAAAGIPQMAEEIPGMNLLPIVRGKMNVPPRSVFGETYRGYARELGQPEQEVLYRWIRRGNHKLIVSSDPNRNKMLFDLAVDPNEVDNLAGAVGLEVTQDDLERRLNQWWNPQRQAELNEEDG